MKDKGLIMRIEILRDLSKQGVGKVAIVREVGTVFEINDLDLGRDGRRFGLGVEDDEGVIALGEIVVGDERRGGAKQAGNRRRFRRATGDEASKANGRVPRGIFLEISGFMSLVDDDEAEIVQGCQQGGPRADDDEGMISVEDLLPGEVAFGFGKARVEQDDLVLEGFFKDGDKLGGESDFGDEEDGGPVIVELLERF